METFRDRLEAVIQEKPLLAHPWYVRWQEGKLTQEELKGYAKEYYAFEKEFSRFLSRLHSQCENENARRLLLENLNHEEQEEATHPELWLRFSDALGLSRESVLEHFHSDETEHLLRVFRTHCGSGNVTEGIAALFAYEFQQPEIARQKIMGLKQHYGVTSASGVSFFEAHQHYDKEHSEHELQILEELCVDEPSQERVIGVVRQTLDAMYEFLDGVDRRYRAAA